MDTTKTLRFTPVTADEWREITNELLMSYGEAEGYQQRWQTEQGQILKHQILTAIHDLHEAVQRGDVVDASFNAYPAAIGKIAIYNRYDLQGLSITKEDVEPYPDGTHLKYLVLQDVDLSFSTFSGLIIGEARFLNCNMFRCTFRAVRLDNCWFQASRMNNMQFPDVDFINVRFENCLVNYSTKFDSINIRERQKDYAKASAFYLRVKMLYKDSSLHDIAGHYYYRERHCSRKMNTLWLKNNWKKIPVREVARNFTSQVAFPFFYDVLCKFGESPFRAFVVSAMLIYAFSIFYLFCGVNGVGSYGFLLIKDGNKSFDLGLLIHDWFACFYIAITAFTTVGFVDWAPTNSIFERLVYAFESVIGVIMTSLYLVTLSRKMIRD